LTKQKTIKLLLPIIVALSVGIGGGYLLFAGTDDEIQPSTNSSNSEQQANTSHTHVDELFIDGALTEEATEVDCTLSDGTESECTEITIAGYPANTDIGPFCPTTTSSTADESGIWLDGENLYDADGEFITNLAEIYDDPNWKLFNDDGTVNVTDTQEAFEAAARPDVDPEYQNYCVEGQIAWLENGEPIESTYLIPHDPVNTGTATQVPGKVGVTLNGVVIDPSAPVDAILSAYTIATFDDCGGHVNPVEGYHIHAATDCSAVDSASDGDKLAIAVAMDGFTIYESYESGKEPDDLDECNGHYSDELGYHYHANPPEENAVLSCFMGAVEESQPTGAGGPPGGAPNGIPPERR